MFQHFSGTFQLQHVFDQVKVMRNYQGLVLLLEEDYYFTPDVVTKKLAISPNNQAIHTFFAEMSYHFSPIFQLQHVFDQIKVMKNYQGLVLLLEEDCYFTPDVVTKK